MEHNIEMDLKEMGWDGEDWIYLTQGRDKWLALLIMVLTLWQDSVNFMAMWRNISFSSRALFHAVTYLVMEDLLSVDRLEAHRLAKYIMPNRCRENQEFSLDSCLVSQ
jgi:hypothetical protein